MFARAIIFACVVVAALAMVSPDPDPESFVNCGVQRIDVLDEMFDVFGLGRNSSVPRAVLSCVWDETDVITPMLKAQIPNGIDDIMQYCDSNQDSELTYNEVLATDTCIGNCGTAISVQFFNTQARNNQSWRDICM